MKDEMNFELVRRSLVKWAKEDKRRAYCDFLITALCSIEKRKHLAIVKDEQIIATISDLAAILQNCMHTRLLKTKLEILAQENLISHYVDEKKQHHITINHDTLSKIDCMYYVEDNRSMFIMYYFAVRFIVNTCIKSSCAALMLSVFVNEAANGYFSKWMSEKYLADKFSNIFSRKEIITARNNLKNADILSYKTVKDAREIFGVQQFSTRTMYELHKERIEAIMHEHIESFEAREYEHINFNAQQRKTLDGVSGDTYTKEEIAEIMSKNADWEKHLTIDDNDDDLPF